MKSQIIISLGLLLTVGCGGAGLAFGPAFPDNRAGQLRVVEARLGAATPGSDSSVVLALSTSPRRLIAFELESGRRLWASPFDGTAIPFLAGDYAISREGTDIVGRTIRDGAVSFSFPHAALGLVGADGDGASAVLTLSTGGGVGAQSQVIAIRNGRRVWTQRLDQAVGRPAVSGGLVFVPWATQNLSVLDYETGAEVARLRTAAQVLGHALAIDGNVFVGQNRLTHITPALSDDATHASAFVAGVGRELPGRPTFLADAYQPPPISTSAVHRIRADWRPTVQGTRTVAASERVYVSFYKIIFALSTTDGEVVWSHELDSDIVGATATDAGIFVVESNGTAQLLSASSGASAWSVNLGQSLEYAILRPGDFSPGGASATRDVPLAEQLVAVIQSRDNRLVPARVLAIQLLAGQTSSETTGYLIDVCDDDRLPDIVREAACLALAERDSGEQSVISALSRRASFLERSSAPPVAALARAAARMGSRSAVPFLINHLGDPDTPERALAPLLVALRELGDASAVQPIRDFLLLYHADLGGEHLGLALAEAARTLVGLEGPVASEILDYVTNDFFSRSDLRGVTRELLEELRRSNQAQASQDTESGTSDYSDADSDLPVHINRAVVSNVLAPVQAELAACLSRAPGNPQSARIVIVLSGFGAIEAVRVLPATVSECIEPIVRSQDFPGNRGRTRQQVTHTIRR